MPILGRSSVTIWSEAVADELLGSPNCSLLSLSSVLSPKYQGCVHHVTPSHVPKVEPENIVLDSSESENELIAGALLSLNAYSFELQDLSDVLCCGGGYQLGTESLVVERTVLRAHQSSSASTTDDTNVRVGNMEFSFTVESSAVDGGKEQGRGRILGIGTRGLCETNDAAFGWFAAEHLECRCGGDKAGMKLAGRATRTK
ncbi:hypothetical protein CC78DRAFT_580663 [Lojkania enalia]|uniref:Uncharacterized protein n=1 Tax=Lojkania enalia TaxID=147567 RepID=A0A9P4K7R1_9PLEO|nr:hypothetical protein CC78DRAFT_580663 [Didymosphaeria enalia]